jgi:hypothetical protein
VAIVLLPASGHLQAGQSKPPPIGGTNNLAARFRTRYSTNYALTKTQPHLAVSASDPVMSTDDRGRSYSTVLNIVIVVAAVLCVLAVGAVIARLLT